MIKALEDITENIESRDILKENDIVLDIGSNDGTLLKSYQSDSLTLVGFEPSNLFKGGITEKSIILNDFFNYEDEFGNLKLPFPNLIGQFQLMNVSAAIVTKLRVKTKRQRA